MNEAYAAVIVPGLFAVMIVGLFMQFIKSRNIKETRLSPYILVFNMFFITLIIMLFLFLAMVIISKFML